MLYLLNHEIFISVLGIQDGIFLYFLFFSQVLRGVSSSKEQSRRVLHREAGSGAEIEQNGCPREGVNWGCLFPEIHKAWKDISTTARVSCSSELGRTGQMIGTIAPSCLLVRLRMSSTDMQLPAPVLDALDHSGHAVGRAGMSVSDLVWPAGPGQ